MEWKYFDLRLHQDFEPDFIERIRKVYVSSFWGETYPGPGLPFQSLNKRLLCSTDLTILSNVDSADICGYAIFSIPDNLFEGAKVVWQDSIAVDRSLQGEGYAKEAYRLINQKSPNSDWLGGRTQNPAVIRAFCKKGKSFPFDERYSSDAGQKLLAFLSENIVEVKESEGIDTSSGIIKKAYPYKLGDYVNDWTGIEPQKQFLETNGFDQDNGDAVIILTRVSES